MPPLHPTQITLVTPREENRLFHIFPNFSSYIAPISFFLLSCCPLNRPFSLLSHVTFSHHHLELNTVSRSRKSLLPLPRFYTSYCTHACRLFPFNKITLGLLTPLIPYLNVEVLPLSGPTTAPNITAPCPSLQRFPGNLYKHCALLPLLPRIPQTICPLSHHKSNSPYICYFRKFGSDALF